MNEDPRHSSEVTVTGAGRASDGGDGVVGLPERFPDPGLPPHRDRVTDRHPAAARAAVRRVAMLFGLSVLGSIGFVVAYFATPADGTVAGVRNSTLFLGLGLFLAMFGIGAAAVQWARTLMSDHEIAEPRHPQRTSDADRAAAVEVLREGAADSGIARRGVLKGALLSAVALAPLTVAVPLIGEIGGTWNTNAFRHTLWKKGTRLTHDPSGKPIKAEDVTEGSIFHVIPAGLKDSEHWIEEKAKAVVLMTRIDPAVLKEAPDRASWSYEGIVAYSKICTHVGCPVALYEAQTHHLLCPCHQSTFDIADGAKVIFGPANRPLPQLPITVDDEGYLVAQSDFTEPIGPSYWERLK